MNPARGNTHIYEQDIRANNRAYVADDRTSAEYIDDQGRVPQTKSCPVRHGLALRRCAICKDMRRASLEPEHRVSSSRYELYRRRVTQLIRIKQACISYLPTHLRFDCSCRSTE